MSIRENGLIQLMIGIFGEALMRAALNLGLSLVLLYGCETWFSKIKGGTQAKDPGSKRDMNEEWRWLHNEIFQSLYRTPNIVRMIKSRKLRWTGNVAIIEEDRYSFKPIGKWFLRRPRRKWDDNIIMHIKEISINMRNWID